MTDNSRLRLSREVVVDGRSFEVTVSSAGGGQSEVEFTSRDPDGRVTGRLGGELSPADLGVAHQMLREVLASLATLLGQPAVRSDREQFPNMGVKWQADEEQRLVERFRAGASMAELSKEFGRRRGGIRSRLERLGELHTVASG